MVSLQQIEDRGPVERLDGELECERTWRKNLHHGCDVRDDVCSFDSALAIVGRAGFEVESWRPKVQPCVDDVGFQPASCSGGQVYRG